MGGLARTDEVDGFRFDRTGHVLHFRDHALHREFEQSVRLERVSRRAAIAIGGVHVPYPLQYNLWALPSRELARSAIAELLGATLRDRSDYGSFAEALVCTWGQTLVSEFLRPYNEKLWGRPLEDLPADCAGPYLPRVDVALAERGATREVAYDGYNGSFYYPASGRFGEIVDALASPVRAAIRLRCEVVAVDLSRRELTTADGETIGYDRLISTIPLSRLAELAELRQRCAGIFAATKTVNVRVGVRGVMRTPLHWVYVPDPALPFHRIGFPRNLNPATCPTGCASLSVEYTPPAAGPRLPAHMIASTALEYVTSERLLDVDEVVVEHECVISPAYVVNRAPGRPEFDELACDLAEHGVRLAGRFGAWDYMSVEEAYASGRAAAAASPADVATAAAVATG